MAVEHAGNPAKGIALVAAAVFLFALQDNAVKVLSETHPLPLIMALRYGINVLILFVLLAPKQGKALFATQRTTLVWLRALCLAAGSLLMGLALMRMPVGEAVAIVYLAPFAVMIAAPLLLGEKSSLAGWIAAAAGFTGVLLIARPGNGLDTLGVVFALGCAAVSTAYHLLTRVLVRTETTNAMLMHTAIIGTVVFSVMLPWNWHGLRFDWFDGSLLLALGCLATLGHFLFTLAYREASASLLAPVNYLHLVWAALLGWIIFGHVPASWSMAGMVLITAAGVGLSLYTHIGNSAE
jgi:drug/metabolite transporter (DMT)-like permease